MIIGGTRPITELTPEELHLRLKQIQEEIAHIEEHGEEVAVQVRKRYGFSDDALPRLREMECLVLSEQGRRGMESEKRNCHKRQFAMVQRDFIDLLHDIDGSRRSAPLFASAELGRARDLVEEAGEIVALVLAGR